jgi:hypothetical protein
LISHERRFQHVRGALIAAARVSHQFGPAINIVHFMVKRRRKRAFPIKIFFKEISFAQLWRIHP